MHRSRLPAALAILIVPLLALACRQGSEPEPRETELTAIDSSAELPEGHPPIASAPNMPIVEPAGGPGLSWDHPETWIQEPPSNAVRRAQYRVPGSAGDGECVVFYFGAGQGGDAMANAQRWADQFIQPDGSSSRQVMNTEETVIGGRKTLLVSVTGTYQSGMMGGQPAAAVEGGMLLGAVVEGPDANWFFKLTGPEETIRANEEPFRQLLASIRQET